MGEVVTSVTPAATIVDANAVTTAQPAANENGAATAAEVATEGGQGEAAAVEKTPEQAAAEAAEAAKQAKRAELSALARAKGAERRAQQQLRAEQAARRQAEQSRQADLERVKQLQEYEAAARDPQKWLEIAQKAGVTAADIGKRILAEGTPEEIQARIEKKAAEIADARLAEWEKKQQALSQKQYAAQVELAFQNEIKSKAADYPAAATMLEVMPDYVMHHARRITQVAAEWNARNGVQPGDDGAYDDNDVAKGLEEFLKPMYTRFSTSNSTQTANSSTQGPSGAAKVGAARAPSVTNAQASSPGSLPANFDKLSKAEQEKFFAEEYRRRLQSGSGRAT